MAKTSLIKIEITNIIHVSFGLKRTQKKERKNIKHQIELFQHSINQYTMHKWNKKFYDFSSHFHHNGGSLQCFNTI